MRFLTAALLVVLSLHATPVLGQDQASEGRARYLAGKALFDSQDYDGAITEYQKSYELTRLPRLLLNIAQAFRLNGDPKNALIFYQRFVAEQPPSEDPQDVQYVQEANGWIEKLGPEVEAKRLQEERRREQLDKIKPIDVVPSPPTPANNADEPTVTASPRSDVLAQTRSEHRWSPLAIAGVSSAGAGVVALGIGGLFGLRAHNLESGINSERSGWTDKQIDDFEDGKTAERRMFLFTGVGAGLIVVGAGLFVFDWLSESDSDTQLTIAPVVDRERAGFALSGAF